MTNTYTIKGMTCSGCKKTVENILKDVEGVRAVEANVAESKVTIESEGEINFEDIKNALADFDQYNIEDM